MLIFDIFKPHIQLIKSFKIPLLCKEMKTEQTKPSRKTADDSVGENPLLLIFFHFSLSGIFLINHIIYEDTCLMLISSKCKVYKIHKTISMLLYAERVFLTFFFRFQHF